MRRDTDFTAMRWAIAALLFMWWVVACVAA
jgi:hypothetical protein